jgi:hypothetical protein
VNGIFGIYRSVDMGTTWRQINDDNFPIEMLLLNIDGSRKEFGLVFVTTGGSGVFYGTTSADDADNTVLTVMSRLIGANVTITGNVKRRH